MIDSLVKLAEKITELLKVRAARRALQFDSAIKPIFEDLQRIHADYLSMLESVVHDLETSMPLQEILQILRQRRLAEEGRRQAIAKGVATLATTPSLKAHQRFYIAVWQYFNLEHFEEPEKFLEALKSLDARNLGADTFGGTAATVVSRGFAHLTLTRIVTAAHRSFNARARMLDNTRVVLQTLRTRWDRIATEYAKELAASLK